MNWTFNRAMPMNMALLRAQLSSLADETTTDSAFWPINRLLASSTPARQRRVRANAVRGCSNRPRVVE